MNMLKFVKNVFLGCLILNFLPNSYCGICDLCTCTEPEESRNIECQGNREIDNYTEIFDLLAMDKSNFVKKLAITNYDIASLPLDAFRGVERLESLDLSDNSMDVFEADIFKDLKNLMELDFSSNKVKILSGAVFNNIRSLLILNLSKNQINDLNETTAGQLPKLTNLDLSYNYLESIDNEFIKSLTNLKILNVSFNRINSISPNILAPLKSLAELRINNNLIKILSGNFPKSLMTLDISGNSINSLPRHLSNICQLNIADNEIREIEIDTLWAKQLEYLNISGNLFASFPNIVFNELKILDLSRNNLSIIPKTLSFENLPNLEMLLIDGNPLKDLRFVEELRLKKLYARCLDGLEGIESEAFVKLRGVNGECIDLTISKNPRLKRIDEGALSTVSICTLDLSKNAFTRISPEVMTSKGKFVVEKGIDLQGNPFHCDCQSQWMLDDLVTHLYNIDRKLLANLRCETPMELSGIRMVHWYSWKGKVFCDKTSIALSEMTLDTAYVIGNENATIRLKPSRGMLAIIAGTMGILCILITAGIIMSRKLELRKRRSNRRF